MVSINKIFKTAITIFFTLFLITSNTCNASEEPIFNEKELRVFSVMLIDEIDNMLQGNDNLLDRFHIVENKPLVAPIPALQIEYERNEVAADMKLKNKPVITFGNVKSIEKTFNDKIVLHMVGGTNQFISPMAYMEQGYENWVALLNRGSYVKLVCSVNGMSLKSVVLSHCYPLDIWIQNTIASIAKALPEGLKNNNEFYVKMVKGAKSITENMKSNSKCFTDGTKKECLDEIVKVVDNLKKKH